MTVYWTGTTGDDRHAGDDREDDMSGDAGADKLKGKGGDDLLDGGTGDDILFGGDGNDTCRAGFGNDIAYGGRGDDTLSGFDGAYLDGGKGFDAAYVTLYAGDAVIADLSLLATGQAVQLGSVTLRRIETGSLSMWNGDDVLYTGDLDITLQGAGGDDSLRGGVTNNHLYGGIGDDVLEGGAGVNYLDGGDGFDTLSYAHADRGVTGSLLGGETGVGEDTAISFEHLVGSAFADTLTGRDLGSRFDMIAGGAGDDRILGRGGADEMSGGAGQDVFVYQRVRDSNIGFDLITDLEADDVIDLSQIDANAGLAGNQAFVLVDALTNAAGEASLTYYADRDQTYLDASVDGGGYSIRIVIAGDWSGFEGLVL